MPLAPGLVVATRALAGSLGPGVRTLAGNVARGAAWETGRRVADLLYGLFLEYGDENPYDQPFRPGVCQIPYAATVTYLVLTPGGSPFDGTFTSTSIVWGPIGRAGVRRTAQPGPPAAFQFFIDLTHYGPINVSPSGPQRTQVAGPGSILEKSNVSILNVQAVPWPIGTVESCPTLPPAPPYRPEDFTTEIDVTYPGPGGANITLPFTAVIAPFFIKNDLSLNMPVTFKLNPKITNNLDADFEVKVDFNLDTGDLEFDWGDDFEPPITPPSLPPATRPPFTPGPRPTPPKPPSIPDVTPPTPEEREGGELIGALVTTLTGENARKVTTIFQESNPDILVPSVGHISFAIDLGDNRIGWTPDIPIKNMRCYIPVPFNSKAVEVKGTPQPGYTWEITPIYTKVLQLAT